MRRSIISLVGAIGELVRFFGIIALSRAFLGTTGSNGSFSLLRYAASAQLLFAGGFFFLWYDPGRYGAYRSLLAAGKALCVLTLAPVAVQFAFSFREAAFLSRNPLSVMTAILAFLFWDTMTAAALIAWQRNHPDPSAPTPPDSTGPGPERMEIE